MQLSTADQTMRTTQSKSHRAGPSLWQPERSGEWATDNSTGRKMADEIVEKMRHAGNPTLLGHTMKAVIAQGVYDGVEVGFFHRLAERLI